MGKLGNLTVEGKFISGGVQFPTADGTNGQVLTTDGAGNTTWQDGGGGGLSNEFLQGQTLEMASGVLDYLTQPRLLIVHNENPEDGIAVDLSSLGHNGSVEGTMSVSQWIQKGYALSLDMNGTDNYISVPNSTDFTFGDGVNDYPFSIGGWYEVVDGGVQGLITKMNNNSVVSEWTLRMSADERLGMVLFDTSVGDVQITTTDAQVPTGWRFIAVTYDGRGGATAGDGIKIYVDGVVVAVTLTYASPSYVAMEASVNDVMIGARHSDGTPEEFWQGDIGMQFIVAEELQAFDIWKVYMKTRGYYNL